MTRHSSPVCDGIARRRLSPVRDGQNFQTEITPDAMLQMHDVIAFLQFGEINVQRGARGLRVRRFEPARTLDFVTAKNFRIGHDHQFGFVANETARQRADVQCERVGWPPSAQPNPYSFQISSNAGVRRRYCKRHARRNPAAASDEAGRKIRGAAPRQSAARARARPADERRPRRMKVRRIAALRIADSSLRRSPPDRLRQVRSRCVESLARFNSFLKIRPRK